MKKALFFIGFIASLLLFGAVINLAINHGNNTIFLSRWIPLLITSTIIINVYVRVKNLFSD